MSKYKRGHQQSVDGNELEIINYLEDKGYFVVRSMDDFLVYDNDECLNQVEVKHKSPFNKNGTLRNGFIKDSQYKMLCHANSSYIIIWNKYQAIDYIECIKGVNRASVITPDLFRFHHKDWLTPKELNRLRQLSWWNLE